MVFLTIGAKENLTPPAMAQALFQSASQPKQLYQVSGADHNDIVEIGGQMLEDRIRAVLQTIQRIGSPESHAQVGAEA
jgi:fermentation-respiration switch protein FrsA (DUF1100 family)